MTKNEIKQLLKEHNGDIIKLHFDSFQEAIKEKAKQEVLIDLLLKIFNTIKKDGCFYEHATYNEDTTEYLIKNLKALNFKVTVSRIYLRIEW